MQAAVDRLEAMLGSPGWEVARNRGEAMSADETVTFAGHTIDQEISRTTP
jgi:hypothetical protein